MPTPRRRQRFPLPGCRFPSARRPPGFRRVPAGDHFDWAAADVIAIDQAYRFAAIDNSANPALRRSVTPMRRDLAASKIFRSIAVVPHIPW
jgi:hypothetical protein